MGVVIRTLNQVHDSSQPALFFNCLLRFNTSPLRWTAWISGRLLNAFFDQNLENLQNAFEMLYC